jgi:hypothetical protein
MQFIFLLFSDTSDLLCAFVHKNLGLQALEIRVPIAVAYHGSNNGDLLLSMPECVLRLCMVMFNISCTISNKNFI